MRDTAAPQSLRAVFDSGDRLDPNDAGYQALAAAVPPGSLAALMSAQEWIGATGGPTPV